MARTLLARNQFCKADFSSQVTPTPWHERIAKRWFAFLAGHTPTVARALNQRAETIRDWTREHGEREDPLSKARRYVLAALDAGASREDLALLLAEFVGEFGHGLAPRLPVEGVLISETAAMCRAISENATLAQVFARVIEDGEVTDAEDEMARRAMRSSMDAHALVEAALDRKKQERGAKP